MVNSEVKVAKSWSTKRSEKRLLLDAIETNKLSTTEQRRPRKTTSVGEKENIKVVEVGEKKDIAADAAKEIEKIKIKVHIAGRTRSSNSKSGSPVEIRQKYNSKKEENL
ncbi:hypothetical protein FXO37_23356 [Capsicum annuum]|nr:hypothetical protein FXO37_23356 [Capsicum annuum]